MTPKDYEVKLRSIMRYLEGELKNARAQYFDPRVILEFFERYARVRTSLKEKYGERFADLLDRDLPKSSGTTDFDNNGYILRRYLDQLYEDCRYAVDLLQAISDVPASPIASPAPMPTEALGPGLTDIFVSHASKDVALVRLFVSQLLRLGLDLPSDRIFCTSLEGMNIRNGNDFREQILKAMQSARIIIFLITPHYRMSEVCQNEMGASWYSGKCVIPFIVDPIDYKSVGVLMEPKQIPKLNDADSLSRFRDDMIRELGLGFKKTDLWNAHMGAFLKEYPAVLASITFPKSHTPKEIDEIEAESKLLKDQLAEAGKKIKQLQDQYEAVVKLKDVKAVQDIEEKFDDSEPLKRFEILIGEVKQALRPFSRVVRAIIVCKYFDAPYTVPVDGYTEDLQTGERRKQIFHDDGEFTPNDEHPAVKQLFVAIGKIERFIRKDENSEFEKDYSKSYESPLDASNEEFWEEHFDLKVPN